MTDLATLLHDDLDRHAAEPPAGGAAAAWTAGRRLRRRRLTTAGLSAGATVALAAVPVALAFGGSTATHQPAVTPAASTVPLPEAHGTKGFAAAVQSVFGSSLTVGSTGPGVLATTVTGTTLVGTAGSASAEVAVSTVTSPAIPQPPLCAGTAASAELVPLGKGSWYRICGTADGSITQAFGVTSGHLLVQYAATGGVTVPEFRAHLVALMGALPQG